MTALQRQLPAILAPQAEPKLAFDAIFHQLDIIGFGRTATYDFLRLLGRLGVADLVPGHCYLAGSSGPLRGARRLFDPTGTLPIAELERRCCLFARALGVESEVLEDTMCLFQKARWDPDARLLLTNG